MSYSAYKFGTTRQDRSECGKCVYEDYCGLWGCHYEMELAKDLALAKLTLTPEEMETDDE